MIPDLSDNIDERVIAKHKSSFLLYKLMNLMTLVIMHH